MGRLVSLFLIAVLLNSLKAASQLHLKAAGDTSMKNLSLRVLPRNFYIQNAGYFCKKEVQMQKALSLPLFIRLGSKEEVDWMERKPNAVRKRF
jgi:hypothetical protein